MDSTVGNLTEKLYGFSVVDAGGRFSKPGWFSQGRPALRCGLCGHSGTVVFRKHYVINGEVYKGRVQHYWAIACPYCGDVTWLSNLEDELKRRYRDWGEEGQFECLDCVDLPENTFLVLANSRKSGSHCVAVVNLAGDWIRPVSDSNEGALSQEQCWLDAEARMLKPLDVVEATFGAKAPRRYQSEDSKTPGFWRTVDTTLSPSLIAAWLVRTVSHGADFIARGTSDRISVDDVAESQLESSLALVAPAVSDWRLRRTTGGGDQVRVSFTLDRVTDDAGEPIRFSLAVTDPVWEKRIRDKCGDKLRVMTSEELGVVGDRQMYFTLSLGEPFNGYHYKLVAAVILS